MIQIQKDLQLERNNQDQERDIKFICQTLLIRQAKMLLRHPTNRRIIILKRYYFQITRSTIYKDKIRVRFVLATRRVMKNLDLKMIIFRQTIHYKIS